MRDEIHHSILRGSIPFISVAEASFQGDLDWGKFGILATFFPFCKQLDHEGIDFMCGWCFFGR
jgi:hypothetical protein